MAENNANLSRCQQCGKYIFLSNNNITISKREYENLLELAKKKEHSIHIPYIRNINNSPIARNQKLAIFIIERYPTMTVSEILEEIKLNFNPKITSQSAVYRFIQAMREKLPDD